MSIPGSGGMPNLSVSGMLSRLCACLLAQVLPCQDTGGEEALDMSALLNGPPSLLTHCAHSPLCLPSFCAELPGGLLRVLDRCVCVREGNNPLCPEPLLSRERERTHITSATLPTSSTLSRKHSTQKSLLTSTNTSQRGPPTSQAASSRITRANGASILLLLCLLCGPWRGGGGGQDG